MKKQIPIFIAGSKSFRQQRLGLKAMANDLNAEYNEQKKDVIVQMYSYENFGDHQQEYNQFITEVSELVLFVLDGSIGQHTEDEFRLAVAKQKKDGAPHILVFLKDFEERTPGISKIEKLLEEAFGPEFYYLSYTNTDDLCNKAKERIQQHVHRTIRRRNIFRQAVGLALIFMMLVASFATANFFAHPENRKPTPTLIFVGGGSAANMLKKNSVDSFDVRQSNDYKMIYINTPSTQAYGMLHDEVKERHALRGTNNNLFYPICLSATQAQDSDFLRKDTPEEFRERGIILSKLIGYDTLEVFSYYKNGVPDSLHRYISRDALKDLLRRDTTLMVYTTNVTSGTYIAYEVGMNDTLANLVKASRRGIYYASYDPEKDLKVSNNTISGFMVLGSQNYPPAGWDAFTQNYPERCIKQRVTLGGIELVKPVYVYMVAYRQEGEKYIIPEVARQFLHDKLDIEDAQYCTLLLNKKSQPSIIYPIRQVTFIDDTKK